MTKMRNGSDEKQSQTVPVTRGEDRRNFLRASLLGGAAIAAGPALRPALGWPRESVGCGEAAEVPAFEL
ncbi:MAG: twin-arginine translocation signal domain-containing protein, partial [Candidatus Acidiferrum sp.]